MREVAWFAHDVTNAEIIAILNGLNDEYGLDVQDDTIVLVRK